MLQDGYPDGDKNNKFLAYEWTFTYLRSIGHARYTPAVEDQVDSGILEVEERVKNFAVFLADTNLEFSKNP
eukprot:8694369-Ditylum_brightwellii.AAC.1